MADVPLADAPSGVDATAWAAACAAVRAYCGWHVAPSVTEEVTVDGSGASVQFLPTLYLTALTITNDGVAVTDPEWSAAGMVRGCWTGKYRGVVATMTHGYESCPPEVLAVISDLVTSAALDGVSSVTNGSHQVQFEAFKASLYERRPSALDAYRWVTVL